MMRGFKSLFAFWVGGVSTLIPYRKRELTAQPVMAANLGIQSYFVLTYGLDLADTDLLIRASRQGKNGVLPIFAAYQGRNTVSPIKPFVINRPNVLPVISSYTMPLQAEAVKSGNCFVKNVAPIICNYGVNRDKVNIYA